jgi:hypothetical protein
MGVSPRGHCNDGVACDRVEFADFVAGAAFDAFRVIEIVGLFLGPG